MRKILFLSLILSVLFSATSNAQGSSSGPAVKAQTPPAPPSAEEMAKMVQQSKEKFTTEMVEKTGLTVAQVHRIIEINFEIRQESVTALHGLNDADRSAKLAELKATKEKRWKEIPLTDDQLKSLHAYYEEKAKNAGQRKVN